MVANTDMRSLAHRATNSDLFEYAARAGHAVAGAIHLVLSRQRAGWDSVV